jgi:hypothetical protein
MSTLKSVGPGWTRTPMEPYVAPPVSGEAAALDEKVEQLRQQRQDEALQSYRQQIHDGVEISAEDLERFNAILGITGTDIVHDRRDIRDAKKCEGIIAEPDPDTAALKTLADESERIAVEAKCESIADLFRGQSIEQIDHAYTKIEANCPWRRPQSGIPIEVIPRLPDRKCNELASAARAAKAELQSAKTRKPEAARSLLYIKGKNVRLWPKE